MQDATCSIVVTRILLLTVAATAVVVFPGHTGAIWRNILLQAGAAAAITAILVAKVGQDWRRFGWPLLAWVVPALLATVFAVDLERSLWGSPYAGGGLLGVFGGAGLALAVSLQADGAVPRVRLLLAGLLPALVGFTLLQTFGLDPLAERASPFGGAVRGPFSDAVGCGGFLALGAAFVFGGAFDPQEPALRRKVYAAMPAISGVGIFLAGVRGPLVAMAAGVLTISVLSAWATGKRKRAKIRAFFGIAGLLFVLSLVRGNPERPSPLLGVVTEAGAARDGLHAAAGRVVSAAPWWRIAIGHGLDGAAGLAAFRRADPGVAIDELDPRYDRLRSFLHEKLITEGWVGLGAFTLLLAYLLVVGVKMRRTPRYGPFGTIAAYVVHRMTNATSPEVELLFAVAVGFLLRPRADAVATDLGAFGSLRMDARNIGGLGACLLLCGIGAAVTLTPVTLLLTVAVVYLLLCCGRPEPLRMAAFVVALGVAAFWWGPAGRIAARDAVRPAFAPSGSTVPVGLPVSHAHGAVVDSAGAAYVARIAGRPSAAFEYATASTLARNSGDTALAAELLGRAARAAPQDRRLQAMAAGLSPGKDFLPATLSAAVAATEAYPWDVDAWRALIRLRRSGGDFPGAEAATARLLQAAESVRLFADPAYAARLASAALEAAAAATAAAASAPESQRGK